MEKPKRLYFWYKRLYFTYKMEYSRWLYYTKDKTMHGWDEWAFFIGLGDKWFSRDEWYYDGQRSKSITLFHIEFGKVFMFDYEEDK